MKNWLFSDGKQKLLEGFCCISMGWVVKVESKKKSAAMKWFPLHKTKVLGGAPDISLGQKYLTTADPFDPNYNTPDQHRDLKKLTCPSVLLCHMCMDILADLACESSIFVLGMVWRRERKIIEECSCDRWLRVDSKFNLGQFNWMVWVE